MADVFYPSCKVRFLLRFESFIPEVATPSPPQGPGPESFGNELFNPLRQDIIPYSCSVTLNSYREADQATITIPFAKLPLDPRIIRACGVQIFAGTIEAGTYAESIGPIGGQSKLELVPDVEPPGSPLAGRSNEIFRGFVDAWKVDWQGDDTITLECRDLTSILLDATLPTQVFAGIPSSLPIDDVIRLVLLGQPPALTLPSPPQTPSTISTRQTARGAARQAQARVASLSASLTKATAAAAANPGDPEIAAQVATLSAELLDANTALGLASVEEAVVDALPIIAQNFGLPGARGFVVVNDTRQAFLPSLGQLHGIQWFDSKGTARKARTGGAKDRISYWDFITDLCVAAGFIVYIRTPTQAVGGILPASEIVISEPRVYYEGQGDPPRQFFYGKNIASLQVQRRLQGKNAPTALEVSGRVAETGETITARWPPLPAPLPPEANRTSPAGPGTGDREELETFLYGDVPGATAQETLQRVAESLFEQRSRGEFEVRIRTSTLNGLSSNFGTGKTDIFQMRSGDTIKIGVALGDPDIGVVQTPGLLRSLALDQRVQVYVAAGLNIVAATQAALAADSPALQDFFRVRSVGIDWQYDRGFEFEIDAINYLDVRNAVERVAPDTIFLDE